MARRSLLSAIGSAGAFVCDTAPLVYRLERSQPRSVLAALDPLFDAVEAGELACIVPAVCAAELLVRPYTLGPPAVSVVDGLLRSPGVAVAPRGSEPRTLRRGTSPIARSRGSPTRSSRPPRRSSGCRSSRAIADSRARRERSSSTTSRKSHQLSKLTLT